jgi:LmbE family N-acetylglucosaminyl deacetylase
MQSNNWYDNASELTGTELSNLGSVLVVAPHQDDESLGCGGTIALLRQRGIPVHVVFVSDGSMSHPNSKQYPAEKLMLLREQEAINALQILDVHADSIMFLRLKDGKVPAAGNERFEEAVDIMHTLIDRIEPQTIMVPWQRDPHPDHRASWQIVYEAMQRSDRSIRKLEYLIWLWERAAQTDLPKPGEVLVWQVDVKPVSVLKKQAIAAHVSQTTPLITDDPEGFTLSPEVLSHFDKPTELFIEQL